MAIRTTAVNLFVEKIDASKEFDPEDEEGEEEDGGENEDDLLKHTDDDTIFDESLSLSQCQKRKRRKRLSVVHKMKSKRVKNRRIFTIIARFSFIYFIDVTSSRSTPWNSDNLLNFSSEFFCYGFTIVSFLLLVSETSRLSILKDRLIDIEKKLTNIENKMT